MTGSGPGFCRQVLVMEAAAFPKDMKALIATLKQHDCDFDLFEAINRINEKQKSIIIRKTEIGIKNKG